MKFVRNGWREKSFFRQDRADVSDGSRGRGKPMAPIGYALPIHLTSACEPPIPTTKKRAHPTGDGAPCAPSADANRAEMPDRGECMRGVKNFSSSSKTTSSSLDGGIRRKERSDKHKDIETYTF
jgi:hypothetical protein